MKIIPTPAKRAGMKQISWKLKVRAGIGNTRNQLTWNA
jgi:hypothetical protein